MQKKYPSFLILGHRGCMGPDKPAENTLAAFEYALNAGADGIEIDVHLSQDRWLVVIHDKTVNRMTNKTGRVKDKKLYTLKNHDIEKGEVIPILEEVLETVERYFQDGRHLVVNIELKGEGTTEKVCEVIASYVARSRWSYQNFIVSSFDFDMLKEVYSYDKRIPIGVLLHRRSDPNVQQIIQAIGFVPYSLHFVIYKTSAALVAEAHAQGIKVICWGCENIPQRYAHRERSMEQIIADGIDGVITNDPVRRRMEE